MSIAIAVLGSLLVVGASPADTTPSVLTAIPAVGTAYWKADCKRSRWALGFRVFGSSATTTLAFHAGRLSRSKVVQPAQTVWFPFTPATRQVLHVDQASGAGRLRAVITLNYAYPSPNAVAHCYSYAPPRLTVAVFPR